MWLMTVDEWVCQCSLFMLVDDTMTVKERDLLNKEINGMGENEILRMWVWLPDPRLKDINTDKQSSEAS